VDKVTINYTPWPFAEIENFLPNKTLKYVKNILKNTDIETRSIHINDTKIDKFSHSVYPMLCNFLNLKQKQCDILYQFNNVTCQKSNIHVDQHWKQLTVVCQISNTGNGTAIYNTDKEYVTTTDWKSNNAVVLPQGNTNWHDVETFENTNRQTLNIIYCPKGLIPERIIKESQNG
jgi:hypothetical protein